MSQPVSSFARQLTPTDRGEAIREAYRKHAAELLAIEDAQEKLVLLLLGVFGAGASFLASERGSLIQAWAPQVGLSIVVVAILIIAGIYTKRRNHARETVRGLLVQCEEALSKAGGDVGKLCNRATLTRKVPDTFRRVTA